MYDEYMQHKAYKLMQSKGFVQGRMLYPITETVYPNALLSTTESGDFWYGDIDMIDFGKLHEVARELEQSINILVNEQNIVISV